MFTHQRKHTHTQSLRHISFDDRHLLKTFNFKNKKKFENYLRKCQEHKRHGKSCKERSGSYKQR